MFIGLHTCSKVQGGPGIIFICVEILYQLLQRISFFLRPMCKISLNNDKRAILNAFFFSYIGLLSSGKSKSMVLNSSGALCPQPQESDVNQSTRSCSAPSDTHRNSEQHSVANSVRISFTH